MGHPDSVARAVTSPPIPSAGAMGVVDADFEKRWAAWKVRGAAHERATRRKVLMTAPIVVIGAAILYAMLAG